jgi:hypothetical protein
MRPATFSPNRQDATSILNEAVRRCTRWPREVEGATQSPSGALRHLPLPGGGDQPRIVVGFSYPGAEKVPEIHVSARRGEHPVAVNLVRRQCTRMEAARESLAAGELWVARPRHFGRKMSPQMGRSRAGLPFLVIGVTPGRLGLLRRRCRRFRAAPARWESAFVSGRIYAAQLQSGVQAALAITHHADASAFRLGLLRRRRRRFRAALARWESAFVSGRIHAGQLQAGVQAALAITHHADASAFRQGLLARRVVLDV